MKVSTNLGHPEAGQTASVTFAGLVKKASESQTTLLKDDEHCSLDPERLRAIGLVVGNQIRVKQSPDNFALYTVSETRPEPTDTTVRMGRTGRQRLGTTEEFEATFDTQGPHPTLSDADAQASSELVERLDDDGYQRELVALAPHGGAIERHTDSQAERVRTALGTKYASAWRCRGFKAGGGALKRWHIKSSEISDASFPLLKKIARRGFAHAVAFHGFDGDGVLVGGAAPLPLKETIVEVLGQALAGTGIQVRIAGAGDILDGNNPSNIVNRLTAGGANGVQIEQSLKARDEYWEAIADAVASVYRDLIPPTT